MQQGNGQSDVLNNPQNFKVKNFLPDLFSKFNASEISNLTQLHLTARLLIHYSYTQSSEKFPVVGASLA